MALGGAIELPSKGRVWALGGPLLSAAPLAGWSLWVMRTCRLLMARRKHPSPIYGMPSPAADALIPHHHIEQFMEQEAAHGIPVHHHCWDDTPHCEHFR